MAFWGIEVKPGKPYTHSSKDGTGRLRISQATLAIGKATLKSLVQCNVGDKRPVLLCALLPDKTESLQLDLEFDEAEDVIFSVIGPRGVYLTGYYVGHNRQSNMQDDTESFGEDIANSETQESNHCSDEDEYEDSFINDDEPEPLTPSPVSSSRDDDEGDFLKKKIGNGGHKRLKKSYQSIVSDDEMSVPEINDEDDFPISSICKNKKSQASEKKSNKQTTTDVLDSKDMVDVHLVDKETKCKGDQPDLAEVVPERKSKTKKKKRESSKDKKLQSEVEFNSSEHDVLATKDDEKPNDLRGVGEVLASAEVVPEKNLKPKKKRKGRVEVSTDGTDNILLAGNKQENVQQTIDKSSEQLANGNHSEEKKVKKKRRKTSKAKEDVEENMKMNDEKENKPSATESESCNKKSLSNGLVIEDIMTHNSKGKVAAAGKKVKVQYVVKLKENGQVIDSTGKSPHKLRLGDKEVIEGLNVGLDGMQVGDRRRITVPPSMSLGYKGTAENIPPNSWLVYDVEMTSIH